ncbi:MULTISPECIES: hypothetical protein [unclassified Methylobacterium]|uniref:hypothetical protein n=1 Tax=unclassified Methylobacterium TaxID=2615210 RepID=UPI00226AF2B8|nr:MULTISPECIES: hypothetical protein [unclassified Methylobacterium]
MAIHLHDCVSQNDTQAFREPAPVSGWALALMARLDRGGARGLIADLTMAGVLTRQAAFLVVSTLDLDTPNDFLCRLGVAAQGAEGIGLALRARPARQIIAAAFAVSPHDVPTGYLRALAKIEEIGAGVPGLHPFADPASYRRLFEVLVHQRHSRRAHALRYSTKLRSSTVEAAMTLDPILVWPEVLAVTGTPQRVSAANTALDLIRACHSTLDEEALVTAMRLSLKSFGVIEAFAKTALSTADRLPTPLPAAEGIRPLRSAAEYREIGARLRNCAPTKIPEAALGLFAIVEVTHRADDGSETILAASLTPTIDGCWMVSEVGGTKNRQPSREVLYPVLRRLQGLGAIIPGPAVGGPYRKDVADLLGIYRYAPLHDALHPHGINAEDDMPAALNTETEVAA